MTVLAPLYKRFLLMVSIDWILYHCKRFCEIFEVSTALYKIEEKSYFFIARFSVRVAEAKAQD